MTPKLDQFFHKWSMYKKCLIVFLAVNVFSVAFALVLGINFFTSKRNFGAQQKTSLEKIASADIALSKLYEFEDTLQTRKAIEIRTHQDEKIILDLLSRWQEVKAVAHSALGEELNYDVSFLILTKESQNTFQALKAKLLETKQHELANLQKNLMNYDDTTKLIILTGLITLIFGVLLPHYVLYLMGRTLNHIRREIQNAALEFVKEWAATKAGFGDDAFKNVEFWLQVLLLLGHQAGRMSSHPAAQVTSELAHIVRLELLKKSTDDSSTAA